MGEVFSIYIIFASILGIMPLRHIRNVLISNFLKGSCQITCRSQKYSVFMIS